MTESNLGLL